MLDPECHIWGLQPEELHKKFWALVTEVKEDILTDYQKVCPWFMPKPCDPSSLL